MNEHRPGPRWSGRLVLTAWAIFAVAVSVAATQVPPYMDSLDQRIVFANPDCMSVVADSQAALGLTVEQRADSAMPMLRSCLQGRQEVMLAHAQKVEWAATLGLLALSVLTLAVTLAWGWERIRTRLE